MGKYNRLNVLKSVLGVAVLFLVAACTSTKPYENAAPGLVEISHNQYFDRVLLPPKTHLPVFHKVYIAEPVVTMSEYWLRTYRGDYTERDLERIKGRYGALLKKSLHKELAKHADFVVVEAANEAEVIFSANLDGLNIYAPDLSYVGRTDHYIYEAGNATFNLQLLAADSGHALAQFVDHSETFSNPSMIRERADRITNARYFSRLMDRWARNLMTYLTEANALSDSP